MASSELSVLHAQGRHGLIEDLERSVASRSIAGRAEVLKRVTDLFIEGSDRYSDDAISMFGDVMMRLADVIEISVRAALSELVASLPNAPPNLVRRLAFDDAINVAKPVLSRSTQLPDAVLAENARTTSQQHLLAISLRKFISEAVTDVLVERGDQQVALSTVKNPGARFSDEGQDILIQRSLGDADLAEGLFVRADIPRYRVLRLLAAASDEVRKRLEAARLPAMETVKGLIQRVAFQLQTATRVRSRDYTQASETVDALAQIGRFNESQLERFAAAGKFEETVVALSSVCELSVGLVERAVCQRGPELTLLLAKASGFSWKTTSALLSLRSTLDGEAVTAEDCLADFKRLTRETARKAVQFLRLRERAAASLGDASQSDASQSSFRSAEN